MPEAATIDAPVAASPAPAAPAATEPSPAPEITGGIEGAMKAFVDITTPKPAAEPKPEPKPDPAKPTADPAPAKSEPKAKPDDLWEKAPPKLKNEYFKTRRERDEFQTKISDYEKRIRAIEAKPVETAGDAKIVEAYKKQIADYEQRIAAADFRQSEAFKNQFTNKINARYKDAVAEISRLQVITGKDEDTGNVTTRPATAQDFNRLLQMSEADQDDAVGNMFGKSAYRVMSRINELMGMYRDAETAISEHSAKAAEIAAQKELESKNSASEYSQFEQEFSNDLKSQWGKYFGPDEKDPDATAALEQGYKDVDDAVNKSANLLPRERAARSALIKGRAAGFVKLAYLLNKSEVENASLKEKLSKYRKSDPGGDDPTKPGAAGKTADDGIPKNIEDAARMFVEAK